MDFVIAAQVEGIIDLIRVLFVCLGNICRSPMAEAVFSQMVRAAGMEHDIQVDSAGLGGWHAGEPPHKGTLQILKRNDIPYDWLKSRQIQAADLKTFDYIIAMDEENMVGLRRLGATPGIRVFRLLDLVPEAHTRDVPDPYYTGNFEEVYDLVQLGCARLFEKIQQEHFSAT